MHEKSIGGVCAGFARYLGVDVTLLRVVWLCTAILLAGTGFLVYLICWIVMPADHSGLPGDAAARAQPEQPSRAPSHPEPTSEPQQG
jgi:phage shock protein PspC (stress-responsive transcriptional regulator)